MSDDKDLESSFSPTSPTSPSVRGTRTSESWDPYDPKPESQDPRDHKVYFQLSASPFSANPDDEISYKHRSSRRNYVHDSINAAKDDFYSDLGHSPRSLFVELQEASPTKVGTVTWREKSRWVKFEEEYEPGGKFWTKPHVATLYMRSIYDLVKSLRGGEVFLDLDCSTMFDVADHITTAFAEAGKIAGDDRQKIIDGLCLRHFHPDWKQFNLDPSLFNDQNFLPKVLESRLSESNPDLTMRGVPKGFQKLLKSKMKMLQPGCEAANVLVGTILGLDHQVTAFVRLKEACHMGDVCELPVPTRFLFILLGPPGEEEGYGETGRAMATLLADELFRNVVFRAARPQVLFDAMDAFIDDTMVLPPGEWDPAIKIEPPHVVTVPKAVAPAQIAEKKETHEYVPPKHPPPLTSTGVFCGGIVRDLKVKSQYYISEYTDALDFRTVQAIFFIFFAALAPAITFGGLLGATTENVLGPLEMILATALCGVFFPIFAGQPLLILGGTGPFVVFETILYQLCTQNDIEFLMFRGWVGLWTMVICFIIAAYEWSFFVKKFTRFTEEPFSALIAVIFIYEAFAKMGKIYKKHPIRGDEGNITLASTLLFCGTVYLTFFFRGMRRSKYFSSKARNVMNGLGTFFTIFLMVCYDAAMGVDTPKLDLPSRFEPTQCADARKDLPPNATDADLHCRGWWVNLGGADKPIKGFEPIVAILPAILAAMLVFIDQQLSALVINNKANKLRKGEGYHLDILVVGIMIGGCSMFGLPWLVAGVVRSIAHVQSLSRMSKPPPGERAVLIDVCEQRVSAIVIHALVGLSLAITPVLRLIPMPVLFGFFLFMGLSSLSGVQFFDRIKGMFQAAKQRKKTDYNKYVSPKKIHLFTLIQCGCLGILWILKSTSAGIIFPLVICMMIPLRNKILPKIFTEQELEYLDGHDDHDDEHKGDTELIVASNVDDDVKKRKIEDAMKKTHGLDLDHSVLFHRTPAKNDTDEKPVVVNADPFSPQPQVPGPN